MPPAQPVADGGAPGTHSSAAAAPARCHALSAQAAAAKQSLLQKDDDVLDIALEPTCAAVGGHLPRKRELEGAQRPALLCTHSSKTGTGND